MPSSTLYAVFIFSSGSMKLTCTLQSSYLVSGGMVSVYSFWFSQSNLHIFGFYRVHVS